jgi:hypothetical protein
MYKNFNLTEEERKQIMEMHESQGYKAPINEIFGATWLTKIKIDSPKGLTDEEKHNMADKFQRQFNGLIAVEFEPGEWFNQNGKIEDIGEYENYVNTEVYGDARERFPNHAEFEANVKKHHRNTEPDSPHEYQYSSFDDYKTRGLTDLTPTERKEKDDAFNKMKETGFSFGVHEAKQKLKESFNRFAINEYFFGDKDVDLIRGNPDFKLKTGRPVGDYLTKRAAAKQFQQDFQKEFPDPGKEYKPYWEKDRPNSSGDNVDDLTPPIRYNKPKQPDSADPGNPMGTSVQDVKSSFAKKQELDTLEKKITALRLFKDQFGLDDHMTELYNNLLIKYREDSRDFFRGGVK